MIMSKPFASETPNRDKSHARRDSRVSGRVITDVGVPLVSPRIIKQREKNWEAFFDKYSQQNPDDKVLNLETLEIEDDPENFSTSCLPPQLPKSASQVQYWVDTGKFPSTATTDISQTASISLSSSNNDATNSPHISIRQPATDSARISKGVLCSEATSSVSSINTIAYLLANATTSKMRNNSVRRSQAIRRSNPINNNRVRRSRAARKSRVASDQVSRLLTTVYEAADSSKFLHGDHLNDACESNNIRANDLSWKTESAKQNIESVKDKSNIASFQTVDGVPAELVENKSSSEAPFDSILERSNLVRRTRKLFTQPDSMVDVHSPIHNSFSRRSSMKCRTGHPALRTPSTSVDGSVVRKSQSIANSGKLRRPASSRNSVKRSILPVTSITATENDQQSEKATGSSCSHTALPSNGVNSSFSSQTTVMLEDYLKNQSICRISRRKTMTASKNNRTSERLSEALSTNGFQESNTRSDSSDDDVFDDEENSSHVRQRGIIRVIEAAKLENLSNERNLNKRESSKRVALDEDTDKIKITPPTIGTLGAKDAHTALRTSSDCNNRGEIAKTRLNHPTKIIGSLSEKDGPLHTLTDVDSQSRVKKITSRKLRTRSSFKKKELTEEIISKEIENTPKPNSLRFTVKLKNSETLSVRSNSPESPTTANSVKGNTKSQSSTTKAARENTSKKRKSSEMSTASTITTKHLKQNASMHSKANSVHLKDFSIVLTRIDWDRNSAKQNEKMMVESSTRSSNSLNERLFPFLSSDEESSSSTVILPRPPRPLDKSSEDEATEVKSSPNNRMTNISSISQTRRTKLSMPQQSNMNTANEQDIRIVANRADEESSDYVNLRRLTRSADKASGRRKTALDSSQNIEMAVKENLATTSRTRYRKLSMPQQSNMNIANAQDIRIVVSRVELDKSTDHGNQQTVAETPTNNKKIVNKRIFPLPASDEESSSDDVTLPGLLRSSAKSLGRRKTEIDSSQNNEMAVEENFASTSQTRQTKPMTLQQSSLHIANTQKVRIVASCVESDKNSSHGNQQTVAETSTNNKKIVNKRIFPLPASDEESSSDDVTLPGLLRSSAKSLERRKTEIDSSQNNEMAVEENFASTSRTRQTKPMTLQQSSLHVANTQKVRIVASCVESDKNSSHGNQKTVAETSTNNKKIVNKRIFPLPLSDEESSSDDVTLPRLLRSSAKSLGRRKTEIDSSQNNEMAVVENLASTSRTRQTKSITPRQSSINIANAENMKIVANHMESDKNLDHGNQQTVAEASTSRQITFDRRILFFSSSDEKSSSDNIISPKRTRLSGKIAKRQTTEVDSSQNDEMTTEGNVVSPKASTIQTQRMKSSKSQQSTLNTVNFEDNRITANQAKLQKNSVHRTQQTIAEPSTSRSKTLDRRRLFNSSSDEESSSDAIFTPRLVRSSDKVSQSQPSRNNGSRSNEITVEQEVASTSKTELIHSNISLRSHVHVTPTKNIDASFATKPSTDEIVSIDKKSKDDMESQAKKTKGLTRNHLFEESSSDDSESDRGKTLSKDETREKSSPISNSRFALKKHVFHLEPFNDNEDSFLKSLDTIISVSKGNADEQPGFHSSLQNASRSLSEKERAKYLKNCRRNQNIVFRTED